MTVSRRSPSPEVARDEAVRYLARTGDDVEAAAEAILADLARAADLDVDACGGAGAADAVAAGGAGGGGGGRIASLGPLSAVERRAICDKYFLTEVREVARGDAGWTPRMLLASRARARLGAAGDGRRWRDDAIVARRGERFVPPPPKETSEQVAATSVNLAWVRRKRKGGVGGGKIA